MMCIALLPISIFFHRRVPSRGRAVEAEVETRTRALTHNVTDINREFSINPLSLDDCRATCAEKKMALNNRHSYYRVDLANHGFSMIKYPASTFLKRKCIYTSGGFTLMVRDVSLE